MGSDLWGQAQDQSQAEALDRAQLPCPVSHATPPPTSPSQEHLANGQNLIGAWGRALSDGGEWARAGPTDKVPPEEGGLGPGPPS